MLASRAALPPVLANWSSGLDETVAALLAQRRAGPSGSAPGPIPVPNLSSDDVKVVSDCIEAIDVPDAKRLANLLRFHQVVSSRLRPYGPNRTRFPAADLVVNCLYLQALVEDCLEFARDEVDHIPPTVVDFDPARRLRVRHQLVQDDAFIAAVVAAVGSRPEMF